MSDQQVPGFYAVDDEDTIVVSLGRQVQDLAHDKPPRRQTMAGSGV